MKTYQLTGDPKIVIDSLDLTGQEKTVLTRLVTEGKIQVVDKTGYSGVDELGLIGAERNLLLRLIAEGTVLVAKKETHYCEINSHGTL